jgi:hypothetical protein
MAGGHETPGLQPHDRLLASHRDRERVTEILKEAFAEGRLADDEFKERVGRAAQARSQGQLSALIADLPPGSTMSDLPADALTSRVPAPSRSTRPVQAALAIISLVLGVTSMILPVVIFISIPGIALGIIAFTSSASSSRVVRWAGAAGALLSILGMIDFIGLF